MLAGMWIKITGRNAVAGGRRLVRRIGSAALLSLAVGAVIGVDPALVGLSTTPLALHAVSFRGPLALASLTVGTAVAGTGSRHRWVAGVLLAAALTHGTIQLRRGWAGPPIQHRADLVVVSLNTFGGAATPAQMASLVAGELDSADAAMVALPETSQLLARQTADLLSTVGHRFQVFSTAEGPDPFGTTSLLVGSGLGAYRQVQAPRMLLGAVLAQPVSGIGPTLAAVHPGAPTRQVGYRNWQRYVTTAVGLCRANSYSIVAGDFNATVDHRMLRGLQPCFDAATRAGRGAEGTWPARLPAVLATPIDHVLMNGRFSVLGTRTARVGTSDHRAVIARVSLPD